MHGHAFIAMKRTNPEGQRQPALKELRLKGMILFNQFFDFLRCVSHSCPLYSGVIW